MATADRLDFTPPPPPGFLRGMGLALLAHALLVVALTYGLQWKRDAEPVSAEAELWSAMPQEAAPREVPAPAPVPVPPPPAPQPVVRAPPQPEAPVQRDAQIAVEREKRQREAAERKQEELERERDKRRKLEALKKREEALDLKKEQQARLEAQKQREEALELKKEQQARLAAEKRKKEDEAQRRQEQDAKKLAQQREENLRRMQGLAGSGSASATGSAAQSSGPSASWGGRVRARVKPNIVFSENVSGNPKADVEVRLAPDGTIVGKRIVKSSGVKSWDEAVLRALDKTETLPRDVDGRVPAVVVIGFEPKD